MINFSLELIPVVKFGQQYLRCHHNEAKGEEETVTAAKNEAVPPLVLVVDHTAMRWITRYVQNRGSLGAKAPVNAVADGQREESHAQVLECHPREQKLRKLSSCFKFWSSAR